MKNLIADIVDLAEKLLRAGFYLGVGLYIGIKALLVIPGNPGIPDWTAVPAFWVAILGGHLLAWKVLVEPTPRQLREERKKAATNDRILAESGKRVLSGDR